jgi:hypothetical protein
MHVIINLSNEYIYLYNMGPLNFASCAKKWVNAPLNQRIREGRKF